MVAIAIWHLIPYTGFMWRVHLAKRAAKQFEKLPADAQFALRALAADIQANGPYRANWKHYSPLRNQAGKYHCHLMGGRPTYVVCWELVDKKNKLVEVYYAGTHENAPY